MLFRSYFNPSLKLLKFICRSNKWNNIRSLMRKEISWGDVFEKEFEIIKKLGDGSYSTVWEAIHRETGIHFAIKREDKIFRDLGNCRNILREVKILRQLDYEGIIRLVDLHTINGPNYDSLLLVLDLHSSDLKKLITSVKEISEENTKKIMYELLQTVSYLHGHGILHRDIKPANILLTKELRPIICDFGLSRGNFDEGCLDNNNNSFESSHSQGAEESKSDEDQEKESKEPESVKPLRIRKQTYDLDRKSTRLNSSQRSLSRMTSLA